MSKVTSTIICSDGIEEIEESNAFVMSGITIPINGNKAKILKINSSFIIKGLED